MGVRRTASARPRQSPPRFCGRRRNPRRQRGGPGLPPDRAWHRARRRLGQDQSAQQIRAPLRDANAPRPPRECPIRSTGPASSLPIKPDHVIDTLRDRIGIADAVQRSGKVPQAGTRSPDVFASAARAPPTRCGNRRASRVRTPGRALADIEIGHVVSVDGSVCMGARGGVRGEQDIPRKPPLPIHMASPRPHLSCADNPQSWQVFMRAGSPGIRGSQQFPRLDSAQHQISPHGATRWSQP